MKKIIFLMLISIGAMAQVPLPKSTTTFSNVRAVGSMTVGGKLRVGSTVAPSATLDVTGTMSVSSTASLGGLNVNSTTSPIFNNSAGSNTVRFLRADGAVEGKMQISTTGVQFGAVTLHPLQFVASNAVVGQFSSSGTFSVQSPMIVGTTTLTGGNTGTVAVLSDVVWNTVFSGTNYNPADLDVRYMGLTTFKGYIATSQRIRVPVNCVLTGWNYSAMCLTSSGSAETTTMSIRVNNTTDYLLSTSITYTAFNQDFSGSGLSISLTAGDLISIKIESPTFATNPLTITDGMSLDFKQR